MPSSRDDMVIQIKIITKILQKRLLKHLLYLIMFVHFVDCALATACTCAATCTTIVVTTTPLHALYSGSLIAGFGSKHQYLLYEHRQNCISDDDTKKTHLQSPSSVPLPHAFNIYPSEAIHHSIFV